MIHAFYNDRMVLREAQRIVILYPFFSKVFKCFFLLNDIRRKSHPGASTAVDELSTWRKSKLLLGGTSR